MKQESLIYTEKFLLQQHIEHQSFKPQGQTAKGCVIKHFRDSSLKSFIIYCSLKVFFDKKTFKCINPYMKGSLELF